MALRKKWVLKEYDEELMYEFAEALSVTPSVAALLLSRGYTSLKKAKAFLFKETDTFHNPFLMPDAASAAVRIKKALDTGEKIAVYGDYDVDGVTSVSVLYQYLHTYTENVTYYIPKRSGEGYGMNRGAIDVLASDGISLIITVDNGITATGEIAYAKEKGIDVIVTDHHECRDILPDCCAVVNPKRPDSLYPFRELAGVGVVFKLISAAELYRRTGKDHFDAADIEVCRRTLKEICTRFADLIAIGTIADVMPVVDENRLIVSVGLMLLPKTKNVGLKALLCAAGILEADDANDGAGKKKITSGNISFNLAPKINAVGRIGDAARAVELFLEQDPDKAAALATELCEMNKLRQAEENEILTEALHQIESEHDLAREKVIVLAGDTWHHGIIGIVASRITEKYHLPSILISFEGGDGTMGKGSGRSIPGMNLAEALSACADLLEKYGGHALAAGLTVSRENFQAFARRLEEYAEDHLDPQDTVRQTEIDRELIPEEIDMTLAEELFLLEPYGIANPSPLFLVRNVKIAEILPISQGQHTKLTLLSEDGTQFGAPFFREAADRFPYVVSDCVDVVFSLGINEYRGTKTVQLLVRDMNHGEGMIRLYEQAVDAYGKIHAGGDAAEVFVPTRGDFAAIFRGIRKCCEESPEDTVISLHKFIRKSGPDPMTEGDLAAAYVKFRIVTEVLSDVGIITADYIDELSVHITLQKTEGKTDLALSSLYRRLQIDQK